MTLKDILKKKDNINDDDSLQHSASPPPSITGATDFRFIRTDTSAEEAIQPPSFNDPEPSQGHHRRFPRFRRHSHTSSPIPSSHESSPARERGEKRLSHRLHLDLRSRSASTSSVNLPADLPEVDQNNSDAQEREAQWEKRATVLAQGSINIRSSSPLVNDQKNLGTQGQQRSRSTSVGPVNDPDGDVTIQEAIRLHEAGELTKSTQMFGKLADPSGANNALSQVLYGLALRHGWGCDPDPQRAVTYLSAAASNSASIESDALSAGMKKGGAAKGELVLAIFELANCFRNGWGVAKDPVAARHYYETAANLGDTDAMNEAAWCFLEGFGGKKDKYMAAKYYRLAEENGNKTLGNTWIWKDKYNPKLIQRESKK